MIKLKKINRKSLACIKREKNFVAVIEKDYPREPEIKFSFEFLLGRIHDELKELTDAYIKLQWNEDNITIENIKNEIADISNLCDYLFEICLRMDK